MCSGRRRRRWRQAYLFPQPRRARARPPEKQLGLLQVGRAAWPAARATEGFPLPSLFCNAGNKLRITRSFAAQAIGVRKTTI